MKNSNYKVIYWLVFADIVIALISLIFFDINTLYNTQIGFISASLVILGSMRGYTKMVKSRVDNEIITTDFDKDVISKLEDPHDLYSTTVEETDEIEDIKKAIKEEKQRLKANKRSLFETLRDSKAALSLYRLGAYIVLILGFMYLNRHAMLHIPSYVIAISLPSIIVAIFMMRQRYHLGA
jgi:hypothetical protein